MWEFFVSYLKGSVYKRDGSVYKQYCEAFVTPLWHTT